MVVVAALQPDDIRNPPYSSAGPSAGAMAQSTAEKLDLETRGPSAGAMAQTTAEKLPLLQAPLQVPLYYLQSNN